MTKPFDVRIGHVLDMIRDIPDESVHCCVTSPPYWGLRNYGIPDQIWGGDPAHAHVWDVDQGSFCECGAWRGSLGLEPDPDLFAEHIVEIFAEVRRVLRDDGTLWLNIGDSYCNSDKWAGGRPKTGKHTKSSDRTVPHWAATRRKTAAWRDWGKIEGLKPKDRVGVPWLVAFALRSDGWWLRSDIIWAKPVPMPESVTDRPTRSHEYIFLLAKSQKYFYDQEAIKEPSISTHSSGYKRDLRLKYSDSNGARGNDKPWEPQPMRKKRDVWTINIQPIPDAHFATYPVALAETCILAGCPPGGIVLDPFSGAGTTGLAAIKHGRRYIGIELNPEYAKITTERTDRHAPLFA